MTFLRSGLVRSGLAATAALGILELGMLCVANEARADDLIVQPCPMAPANTPCTTVQGNRLYDAVRIAALTAVAPYDPDHADAAELGWVHIKAHEINIEQGGIIDAVGAGFRGTADPGQSNRGPGSGGTALEIFSMTPAPGGGASHSGTGGLGTDSCTAFVGAEAGLTYNTDVNNPPFGADTLGSAGGASRSTSNDYIGRGGNGGGGVILEAARITIDGTIRVNGENGPNNNLGDGPGGGSGGTIVVIANELTVGASASFQAVGGNGALASLLFGGAGGGGLVVLSAPGDLSTALSTQANVTGGVGATACCQVMMQPFSCGGAGLKAQIGEPGCIDADGDGFPNELCGGNDCNDGSANENTDIAEICNGIDDNCDGQIDEPEAALCQAGFECVDSTCVEESTTSSSGSSGPVAGPGVQFSGGLCATSGPLGNHNGRPLAPWALLLAAAGLGYHLRRRSAP